jgi:hypothetical protein
MPAWVLPAVAAELWGVSQDQVLADVAAGRVRCRQEGEFLFVDVAASIGLPDVPEVVEEPRPAMTYRRRSLAWSVPNCVLSDDTTGAVPLVTPAEREALLDEMPIAPEMTAEACDEDPPAGDAPEPEALTQDDVPDWQAVRARVSRMRKPPTTSRQAA